MIDPDPKPRVAIPPLSIETQKIMTKLRTACVGDVVHWDELEGITGRSRDTVRNLTMRARRKLEESDKIHFRTLDGTGVERIDFSDVTTDTLPRQRNRIVGAARRMVRTTRNVVLDQLDQSQRATVLAHQTLGLLTESACSNKNARALSAGLQSENRIAPLSPGEAMQRMLAGHAKKGGSRDPA